LYFDEIGIFYTFLILHKTYSYLYALKLTGFTNYHRGCVLDKGIYIMKCGMIVYNYRQPVVCVD